MRVRLQDASERNNEDWIDGGKNEIIEMIDFIVSEEQDGNQLSTLNTLAAFNRQLNRCVKNYPDTEMVHDYFTNIKESLKLLKLECIYRYDSKQAGLLTAIMWNIDYQRTMGEKFGDVIFWDGTCNTNDRNWSLFAPTVVTENGKLYPICFGLIQEEKTSDSQIAMLQMLIELMPCLKEKCKTIFSDQGTSQEMINEAFRHKKTTGLLCVWHLQLNISSNLASTGQSANVKKWFKSMVNAQTVADLDQIYKNFINHYAKTKHKKVSQYFTEYIWKHRNRWAKVYIMKTLTFGYGTNLSESLFSSLKAWLPPLGGRRTATFPSLISSLIYYAMQHQRQFYEDMCKFEIVTSSQDTSNNVHTKFKNTITTNYGKLCSINLEIQFGLSANYECAAKGEDVFEVYVQNSNNDRRTVSKQQNGDFKCTCQGNFSYGYPC